MQCPFCHTENREDRERCYQCDKDISMLRLIVNKARHHYNVALEHAERGRTAEAIDELHNALDLDRRFTNAHVVLGTLYAKQGDFDRARESWTAALALQPELSKAHQYLHRVEKVERQLPAIRRLRMAAAVLLLATVVLGISLLISSRRSPATQLVRQAQSALSQRNYGRALDHLTEARRTARPDSMTDIAATALQLAVQSELRQEVRHIQDLKYREEYPKVLSAIADLEARRPDTATSAALVNIREDVNHYYLGQLRRLFEDYESEKVAYNDFVQKARDFLSAYPEIPEKKDIAAYLDRARELEVRRSFATVRSSFESTGDIDEAVESLRRLGQEYPESQGALEGRAETVDLILSAMFDEFQGLVDQEDFAEAAELLSRIQKLAGEFRDVVDVSGPVDLAGRVLSEVWTGARLKEAEQLVRNGNVGEAREALLLLGTDTESLTTSARDLVANLEDELDRRENEQEVTALQERRSDLMEGTLEDADATKTFSLASTLAGRQTDPKLRAEVLAYAAAAAFQAGNRELAAQYAARARSEGTLDAALGDELQRLLKRKGDDLQRRPQPSTRRTTPAGTKTEAKPEPKSSATKPPARSQREGRQTPAANRPAAPERKR